MQLTGRQVEQLVACRRTLFAELGMLIAEWYRLWAQLKVGPIHSSSHHFKAGRDDQDAACSSL